LPVGKAESVADELQRTFRRIAFAQQQRVIGNRLPQVGNVPGRE